MTSKKPRRGRGEGSIFYREDRKVWIAELPLETGKSKYFSGKTYAEAQRQLNQAKLEQQQGILASGPKQTVKDFLNYWLEEVHKATLKVSTYALYRRHLDNHLIPQLGHIQLQKLKVDHVQAFLNKAQKEGLQASTIKLIYTILDAALNDAIQWKRLVVNICQGVKLPRQTQREVPLLGQEQARRFIQSAQGNRLDCIITLALTSAMRLGEILALRWEDIDVEKRELQVRHTVDYIKGQGWVETEPKTKSGRRTIRLTQIAVEALRKHRISQVEIRLKAGPAWEERGLIFPNRNGGYFRRPRLYAIFKKLLQEAGLPDMHFHDLRHNAATILLTMGVSMKAVQEILGHGSIVTTMNIYGHVLPSTHREAMDDMDDWFGNESKEEDNSGEKD